MKHVIGKRDGKTIVSGGGSLEEQKNNLKHWEVLDEESSPAKEQYNKRIKIDPQDVFLLNEPIFSFMDIYCAHDYRSVTIIGELDKLPIIPQVYDFEGRLVKHSAVNTENIIESMGADHLIYKPIKGDDGVWEFIVPVAYNLDVLDRFNESDRTLSLIVGFPCHYKVREDSDGNVFVKAAPNGTGIDACEKKYNVYDGNLRYYSKPSSTAINNSMVFMLQRNTQVQNFSLTIDDTTGYYAKIKSLNITDDSNGFTPSISDRWYNLSIPDDLIPVSYPYNTDKQLFEFPKMRIRFIVLSDPS